MNDNAKRCGKCRRLYRLAAFDTHRSRDYQPFCRACDWDAKRKPHRGWESLLRGAGERDLVVTITREEYLELVRGNKCHWCQGELFLWGGYWIDRYENRGHYDRDNVVPCCRWCNRYKGDLPVEIWKSVISAIIQNHGRRGEFRWISLGRAFATKRPDVSEHEIRNAAQLTIGLEEPIWERS